MALDYGSARTGVAVSDATGTIATPAGVVEDAASEQGLGRIDALVREHGVRRVVVGMPYTLSGEKGSQAIETESFVAALGKAIDVPVETYDERFTTTLAGLTISDAPEDALAAAHLLAGYLEWAGTRGE